MAKARKTNGSPQADEAASLPQPSSKRRKWLFRLALLILSPLIFFGALEGILRLTGFGYPSSFLLHQTLNGQERVIENGKFGWRFFGPALARTPYPLNFPEVKSNETVRIFIFGESAAYGDPQPDFGLPRMLGVLLRARYPGVHFEIINAAMVAINSNVILPIARDCAKEHGDIWLVYMGNNEVVGPFGSGTVFGPQAPPLPLIHASVLLKSTRTGELFSDLLARAHSGAADSSQWRGMMMFIQNQVRQDDPRMARTYAHFENNLTGILQAGTVSGAKVIVSTVASNMKDCAPFASQHSPALTAAQSNEWTRLYQRGIESEAKTNATEAMSLYEQAAKLDGNFADLQFRWARMCLAAGDEKAAQEHFRLARDCDTLRFRADSRINEIIREAAVNREKQGIFFVDAAKVLGEQSAHGICGNEFFYEHVHFTFAGNYALARMFADQIAERLPAEVRRRAALQAEWLAPDACARLLGWNDWSKHQVLESLQVNVPPFNFQLNHKEMLEALHRERERLAQGLNPTKVRNTADEYRRLIGAATDDWVFRKKLAEVLQELDDLNGAAECWRQVESLIPQSAEAPLHLSLILSEQGKYEEAADEFLKAVKLDRHFAENNYASLFNKIAAKTLKKNGPAPAVPMFQKAISLRPNFAEAHLGLGSALSALGKTQEAQEEFRAALRNPPTTPPALVSLGIVCYREGWTNEAIRTLEAALDLDPTDGVAHFYLGVLLFDQQNRPEASEHFREALRIDPQNAAARDYLDRIRTNHMSTPGG